ncbi:MAG: TlpA disulfide reductase family protein [Planctomycetota bacterium]|nr:TlpA disulfide reductase family protein [Planctomycetota bacterium]MDA1142794.1 TlpA disulfide reductase family protein [Planctomycetota bacterium]
MKPSHLVINILLLALVSNRHLSADPANEWKILQASLAVKMKSIEGPQQLVPLFESLESFVKEHPGTNEASMALCNLSSLLTQIGKIDAAISVLEGASSHTLDKEILASIQAQITRLSVRPGGRPPDFRAKTLDGKDASLSAYKGKNLLFIIWATWCGPCRGETPFLKEVYQEFPRAKFDILGVSLDENKSALTGYLKQHEMPWPQIYNKDQKPGEGIDVLYNTTNIPLIILIGPDGKIIKPGLRGQDLKKEITAALDSQSKSEVNQ